MFLFCNFGCGFCVQRFQGRCLEHRPNSCPAFRRASMDHVLEAIVTPSCISWPPYKNPVNFFEDLGVSSAYECHREVALNDFLMEVIPFGWISRRSRVLPGRRPIVFPDCRILPFHFLVLGIWMSFLAVYPVFGKTSFLFPNRCTYLTLLPRGYQGAGHPKSNRYFLIN